MDKKHGLFLVFEGCDGTGKTTQASMLASELKQQGYPVLLTKEPGAEEPICKLIREMVLHNKSIICPATELLLFLADRAQHVAMTVRPFLETGGVVISDRFIASTYAYQCIGRNYCPPDLLERFNSFASKELYPDYTFWLDMDVEKALARNTDRADRFQSETIEFHRRVQSGYIEYFKRRSGWKIDANRPPKEIHQEILTMIPNIITIAKVYGWLRT